MLLSDASTTLTGVFAGRYTILRELGRGATAFVYLATDQQRGHAVAIKVLRPEFAESLGADRFLKEIRLGKTLLHPHILPVLDSGTVGKQLYFVLPAADGGTLRMRLARDKQLPLEEVVAITRTVATALTHAHEKGLIHRDVKPENILFASGQACLGDFGIARALERAMGDTTTSESIVRGTPAYMSPEQASAEQDLDGRSDIYSLGCVVYEMLAGIQAFVGPTPQSIIAQRFLHAPRAVRVFRPGIPKAVEAVVSRALAVSRADRFQSATDFADALEVAVRTPDEKVLDRMGRRSLAIIGTVAVLAAAAIFFVANGKTAPPKTEAGIPEGDPRRIAVLYLDDLTPTTLPTYVADGITEDLIDQLGSVSALNVISPYGVRPFRGGGATMDSVAKALKVGTIITGSVARSGNIARLNVRLVDAHTGQQLASWPLERQWTELFTLQKRLADTIAFALRKELGVQIGLRTQRATTKSLAAWEAAQLADAELGRADSAGRQFDLRAEQLFIQADSEYVRASKLDPLWEYPIRRRGRIAVNLGLSGTRSPNQVDSAAFHPLPVAIRQEMWYRRAVALANEALAISPRSAEAFALRGRAEYFLVGMGVPGKDSLASLAERDLRAALTIRSDLADAWVDLGYLMLSQGRFGDAAAATQRAYEADPFFETRRVISTAFFASLYSGQYDDARRWCNMGLEHYAEDVRFTECALTLLGWTGRTATDVIAARRALEDIERRDTRSRLVGTWGYRRMMIGAVLARAGMRDSARALLTSLHANHSADSLMRSAALGESYVWLLLNERDTSLARLAAYVRATPAMRSSVANHPWFQSLKGDPRFTALLQPAH